MGWPKGKSRKPQAAQATSIDPVADPAPRPSRRAAPASRTPSAAPSAPVGHNSGRAVAVGRDGEMLTRLSSTINNDKFYVDDSFVPAGWKYQWNVVEVLGQPSLNSQITAHRGGWRPVPADRHDGIWTQAGYKGDIVVDGLRLEERPKILDDEAKAEENAKARRQVIDQQEQLMLSKKGALGDGFSDDAKYRGVGATARQTIAPAPDAPRPRLEIDPAQ
jgi:hypothetical protein